MPPAAQYSASLPMEIAMPPAPWSPMPRMDSLSVATMSFTGRPSVALRSTSATRPRWSGVIHTPRARRKTWLNSRVARPTVGV